MPREPLRFTRPLNRERLAQALMAAHDDLPPMPDRPTGDALRDPVAVAQAAVHGEDVRWDVRRSVNDGHRLQDQNWGFAYGVALAKAWVDRLGEVEDDPLAQRWALATEGLPTGIQAFALDSMKAHFVTVMAIQNEQAALRATLQDVLGEPLKAPLSPPTGRQRL